MRHVLKIVWFGVTIAATLGYSFHLVRNWGQPLGDLDYFLFVLACVILLVHRIDEALDYAESRP